MGDGLRGEVEPKGVVMEEVIVKWFEVTTSGKGVEIEPPEGYTVGEVLPAASSNGLGVLVVFRPQ